MSGQVNGILDPRVIGNSLSLPRRLLDLARLVLLHLSVVIFLILLGLFHALGDILGTRLILLGALGRAIVIVIVPPAPKPRFARIGSLLFASSCFNMRLLLALLHLVRFLR